MRSEAIRPARIASLLRIACGTTTIPRLSDNRV